MFLEFDGWVTDVYLHIISMLESSYQFMLYYTNCVSGAHSAFVYMMEKPKI